MRNEKKKHLMCLSSYNVTLTLVMIYSMTKTLTTADRVMQLRGATVYCYMKYVVCLG